MSAHAATPLVGRQDQVQETTGHGRLVLFIVCLICGLAVLVFGAPYFELFWTNKNVGYQAALAVLFLMAAGMLKRDERLQQYWRVAFAFFMASSVIVVTLLIGGWGSTLLARLGLTITTSQGLAVAKLYEAMMIVVPIIILTKLSGADLGSIYLKRGDLKWGLSIGALVFFNFAASAFLFFATRFRSGDTLAGALVWGMVFSVANGFMEELWLRGILLRPLQRSIGLGGAVLLTSIVFSLMHGGALYLTPIAIPFMVANTFTLGLACGYLTIKTDSIWGATLIHVASDLFLFVAMLANA